MLLIAAVGLWLIGLKFCLSHWEVVTTDTDDPNTFAILYHHDYYGYIGGVLAWVDEGLLYFLAMFLLTLFYLCARLRAPRLPLGRLIAQPGMLICMIVAAAYLVAGCFTATGETIPTTPVSSEVATRSYFLSAAVGCAWLAAYSVTRRRIEPGWIERLGRALGIGWIGIGLVNYVILNLPQVDLHILTRP